MTVGDETGGGFLELLLRWNSQAIFSGTKIYIYRERERDREKMVTIMKRRKERK